MTNWWEKKAKKSGKKVSGPGSPYPYGNVGQGSKGANPNAQVSRSPYPYGQLGQGSQTAAAVEAAQSSAAPTGASGGVTTDPFVAQLGKMLEEFEVIKADPKNLKKQAFTEVGLQYDPRIRAIAAEMADAKTRGNRATGELDTIYDALSNYYTGEISPSKARTKSDKSQAKNRATSQKAEISKDYANRLREQVDLYKQLGIEAAAPSTLTPQAEDQAGYQAQADLTNNAEQAALGIEGQADENYWRHGAANSQQEGAENKSQVIADLTSYLNRMGSERSGLIGDKGAAQGVAFLKLQGEAAQSENAAKEAMWKKMLEYSNFAAGQGKTQFDQNLALRKLSASESGPTKLGEGLSGAYDVLGRDSNLMGRFEELLSNASKYREQKASTWGNRFPDSPENLAQLVQWGAQRQGLPADIQQKLYEAALIYRGRGR